MLFMNVCAAVEIGNRAGYFEDAGVGSGGETETISYQFQHAVAGGVEFAVFLDEAGCHLGIAVDFGAFIALQLDFSRTCHSLSDLSGTLRVTPVYEVTIFDCRNLDMNVDSVE